MTTLTIKRLTFPTVTARPGTSGDEPEITISTIDPDRVHDRVVPEGVRLEAYMRNPVVFYSHRRPEAAAIPIATTTHIMVEPGRGLRARFRWLENDPFADRVKNAWDQGILRTASIGFMPITSKPNELGGEDWTASELTEWSLEPMPANPFATRRLKALGLWGDDDDSVLTITDDQELIEVDENALRVILRETVADAFTEITTEAVTAAINAQRGLVD